MKQAKLSNCFRKIICILAAQFLTYYRIFKAIGSGEEMRLLVVGGGGREHALVWKLRQSPLVEQIFCAPGNAGIAGLAECVPIGAEDIPALRTFAQGQGIDLTVVGPEAPLVAGIVDAFQEKGLKIFGPTAQAAQLEGSKAFAKDFMHRHGIPTASYEIFTDFDRAKAYVETLSPPLVVKADGLAAGKGSIVCHTREQALRALEDMLVRQVFKSAGQKVVVEEFLEGEEASVLALSDGERVLPFVPAQDHKPVYDGDRGPNTGGMGAYAPAPVVTPEVLAEVQSKILEPAVQGMAEEGIPYQGVLYAGLMITPSGPKVLEFNCRFGDPETQAILPLMESDLMEALQAAMEGRLDPSLLRMTHRWAVCVVLASGGYPGSYEKGKEIFGLDQDFGEDVMIFHAGTRRINGRWITSGGRVLGVTALGDTLPESINRCYQAVERIHFEKVHFRRDIGQKGLRHLCSQ